MNPARIFLAAVLLWLGPVSARAAPAEISGDLPGFRACVGQMLRDEADNFMAGVMVPVLCGRDHIPRRQSCPWPEYLPLESREICERQDLDFWQAQVRALEAEALAEGRRGTSGLFASGLERCAEAADKRGCLWMLYWREALGFLAAPILEDVAFEMAQSVAGPAHPEQVVQIYHACLAQEEQGCGQYALLICRAMTDQQGCFAGLRPAFLAVVAQMKSTLPVQLPEDHPQAARFARWRSDGASRMSSAPCDADISEAECGALRAASGAAEAIEMAGLAEWWIGPILGLSPQGAEAKAITISMARPVTGQCLDKGIDPRDCVALGMQMCALSRPCFDSLGDEIEMRLAAHETAWPDRAALPEAEQECPDFIKVLDACAIFEMTQALSGTQAEWAHLE